MAIEQRPRTLTQTQFDAIFDHFVKNILPWCSNGPWDFCQEMNEVVADKGVLVATMPNKTGPAGVPGSQQELEANIELISLSRNVIPILLDTLKYGFADGVKTNAKKNNRVRKTSSS